MLPMLGDNYCLPLLHMAQRFISINETKHIIDEFAIEYMINSVLHVNKAFRDQI